MHGTRPLVLVEFVCMHLPDLFCRFCCCLWCQRQLLPHSFHCRAESYAHWLVVVLSLPPAIFCTTLSTYPTGPSRCLQALLVVAAFLAVEVNVFFLKYALWVPPTNPLNTARLVLWLLVGAPAVREYYEFIEVGPVRGQGCGTLQKSDLCCCTSMCM